MSRSKPSTPSMSERYEQPVPIMKAVTSTYHAKRKKASAAELGPKKCQKIETPPAEEPKMSADEVDGLVPQLPHCPALRCDSIPYTPEAAFKALEEYMNFLLKLFQQQNLGLPATRIEAWTSEVVSLKTKFVSRTVIAVLGATGAGKSTLLNAVLDQPELLPANCMRACTSAPVELAYHDKDTFDANIFILSEAEWKQEALQLRNDLLAESEGHLHGDSAESDEELIDIAKSKFAAVHPEVSIDDLQENTLDEILSISAIRPILGTVVHISCSTAEEFAIKIGAYIDNKNDGECASQIKEAKPQLWPLVKCVQCHIRADALSTGATLVDLPGMQDINPARAKIAHEYMKIADAYWIVAPIHRAVSDKVAQDLLGDAFRRQLLMDCSYTDAAITFICTKTDQITATEALRSLPNLKKNERIKAIAEELKQLEQQGQLNEKTLAKIHQIVKDLAKERAKIRTELDTLQRLLGGRVSKGTPSAEAEGQEIVKRISASKDLLDEISERLSRKDREKRRLLADLQETRRAASTALKKRDNICALARNDYAKLSIQKHFRAGRRQMDAEQSAPKFERGTEDIRSDLPVFCASAQDYVRAKRLYGANVQPVVFDHEAETEIPELRQHIKRITWRRRDASVQKAIQLVEDFLRSVEVYLAAEGETCSKNGETVRRMCMQELYILSKAWDSIIDRTCSTLRKELRSAISPKMNHGAKLAGRRALSTVEGFGDGKAWNTYRAHMVREGVWRENINVLLSEPILKEVASAWRRAFENGANGMFLDLPKVLMEKAEEKLNAIEDRAEESIRVRVRAVARQQHKTIEIGLKGLVDTATTKLKALQRDVSRQITPDVQYQLSEAYTDAGAQRGKQCLNNMKTIINTHVEINALKMFTYTTTQTIDRLDKLGEHVYEAMKADLSELQAKTRLGFSGIWENMKATPEQILLRRAVRHRTLQLMDITSQLLVMAKQANEATNMTRAATAPAAASSNNAPIEP